MKLLDNVTATGAGSYVKVRGDKPQQAYATFQAVGAMSSGTGSATINVEVSNNATNWLTLGTITLSLSTTAATDGFVSNATWTYVRGNVTALTANGTVSLVMGT